MRISSKFNCAIYPQCQLINSSNSFDGTDGIAHRLVTKERILTRLSCLREVNKVFNYFKRIIFEIILK